MNDLRWPYCVFAQTCWISFSSRLSAASWWPSPFCSPFSTPLSTPPRSRRAPCHDASPATSGTAHVRYECGVRNVSAFCGVEIQCQPDSTQAGQAALALSTLASTFASISVYSACIFLSPSSSFLFFLAHALTSLRSALTSLSASSMRHI
jgi:hypothetical protein